MNLSNPLVSIVIPTYNHAHFLKQALQSICDQTYTNWEAIVVDNHSKDDTDEVVSSFTDTRIKILKIHNQGIIAASRNKAIEVAKGEWIAFLDSDDYWYPEKLRLSVNAVVTDPSIDICSNDELLLNELTGECSPLRYGPFKKNFYYSLLTGGNCMSPSASIVKHAFLKINQIRFRENPAFVTAEDYDFWLLLAKAGARCCFISSIQGVYRVHANNNSSQLNRHFASVSNVMRDHVWNMQITKDRRERMWRYIESKMWVIEAKELFRNHKFSLSIKRMSDAIMHSPAGVLDYFYQKIQKKIKSKFHKIYIWQRNDCA